MQICNLLHYLKYWISVKAGCSASKNTLAGFVGIVVKVIFVGDIIVI
jgi:hypothetical protein